VPLKAIVDGKTFVSPDLFKEERITLQSPHKKGLSITMGCCGAPKHVRISKKEPGTSINAVDSEFRYGSPGSTGK
jgi:hypothetical protein